MTHEPRQLVSIEDTRQPECTTCHHVESMHGDTGCHAGKRNPTPSRCGCTKTHREVTRQHIETIVRREIAAELDLLASEDAEDMLSANDYSPDATIYRATRAEIIADRAEEIRNAN